MSDTDPAPAATDTTPDELQDQLPEEWKPEPREWTWKDVFTAPMLAFKPKCMLISLLTVVVVAAFGYGWMRLTAQTDHIALVGPVICWLGLFLGAVLFSLGASLVSVFYKADLLDDEFLSFGEACKQYFPRLKAVLLVPLTLVGILAGMNLFLWFCQVIGSIPFVGPVLYGVLYPLGWLLALLIVLLVIAVSLAVFVGPAVLAVRKHGWFDNVIDVFEAVGTKPHQLVGNLLLTGVMIAICYLIPTSAMGLLKENTLSSSVPTHELAKTEAASDSWQTWALPFLKTLEYAARDDLGPAPTNMQARVQASYTAEIAELREELGDINSETASTQEQIEARNARRTAIEEEIAALQAQRDDNPYGGWNTWAAGIPLAFWQLVIFFGIVGYCLNVFLAGGMLTYLAVREDDYWDDEDLEDLDKLAKELEEEAKREAEQAGAETGPESDKATETAAAAAASDQDDKQDQDEQDKQSDEDKQVAAETDAKQDEPDGEPKEGDKTSEPEAGQQDGADSDKKEPEPDQASETDQAKDSEAKDESGSGQDDKQDEEDGQSQEATDEEPGKNEQEEGDSKPTDESEQKDDDKK